MMTSTE